MGLAARLGSTALFVGVCGAVGGCYLSHEPAADDAVAAPPDGGPRVMHEDAGLARDASEPPDAGRAIDAGEPPLPEEPDPDLGPDSRPSDYVEAGDWPPPPDIAPDDLCCTLGDPIRITSRDEGMALGPWAPSMAWGAGRWGLLAARTFLRGGPEFDPHQIVFELAADGTP